MNKRPAHAQDQIELRDAAAIASWVEELGVPEELLREALDAVGSNVHAVRAYIAGTQSGIEGFVRDCQRRIEEIEAHIDELDDERERLSDFLEQFLQLRAQMNFVRPIAAEVASQAAGGFSEALAQAASADEGGGWDALKDKPRYLPDGPLAKMLSMPLPVISLPSRFGDGVKGDGAKVTDAVYRLLKDGKRRKIPEILSYLQLRGITLEKSKNPAALLSTLLSKDERFIANRKAGWGLYTSIALEMSDLANGGK